jgi:putative heme-binding domain-containing protein
MAAARLKELPGSWCGALARTLGEGKADLVEPALAAARSAPVPAAAAAPLAAALAGVARARDLPVELRTAALAARPGGPHEVDPEELALLRTAIGPGQPAGTRTLAAGVLGRAHLSGAALRDLVGAVEVAGPMELVQMLPAYRGIADEALAAALLGALERSHGRASLRPDIVRPIVAGCGEATRRRAEALLDTLDPDSSHQKAHLEDLESALGTGDVRRGQAIFNGQTAACSRCHAVGYLGGRVGPDLTRIGQIRTARDLLEAVVYPNASFARSYEPMVVTTRSGDEHSGVVRRDAPEEVVLQTSATDEVRIARGEIAAMRPGTVSVMPSGLEQQLSRQELADLIAFLQSRK